MTRQTEIPGTLTREAYRLRLDRFSAVENRYTTRERMVMQLRVALFLAAVSLFIVGWNRGGPRGKLTADSFQLSSWDTAWYLAGSAAAAGFVAAVVYHEQVRRQIERHGLLRLINHQAIARLERDWATLPEPRISVPPEHRPVADDLDLFGHASLFQMLSAANTPMGLETLRDWLLQGASTEEIPRRQEGVAELAPQLELRQMLDLEGRLLADGGRSVDGFLGWAEGTSWLAARPRLQRLLWAMSAAVPLLAGLTAAHVLSPQQGMVAIFAAVTLNLIASAFLGWRVHSVFSQINVRYNETAQYARMFRLMYAMPGTSPEVRAIKDQATQLGGGVLRCLGRLQWIVFLARIRHSAMLFVFVYLPLQVVLLYDFHILTLLEVWQKEHGRHSRLWFQALGRLEALSSLAALVHDYPHWAMPKVDAAAGAFQARQLGHPLLADGSRVANDVEFGPRGSFLLVTGSNMSGKSTLLRAIGIAAVMAQAGAPVCGGQLQMPPLALATSMRVRDSLEGGVSFYMAELLRLKQIVDLARNAQSPSGRLLLYLLDEILMGTNSKERHIAVVRVMEHLLRHDAIGAVSTHDLDLATSPQLSAACCCVHFRETLHDECRRAGTQIMTFDYCLRPGVATTSNALKLLEIVGLGESGEK